MLFTSRTLVLAQNRKLEAPSSQIIACIELTSDASSLWFTEEYISTLGENLAPLRPLPADAQIENTELHGSTPKSILTRNKLLNGTVKHKRGCTLTES